MPIFSTKGLIAARLGMAAIGVAAMCAPVIAQAQAYQCQTGKAPVSVRPVKQDGPTRRMRVTGYALALSWAPEHCRGREKRANDAVQCSGKHGRFGLIVHGLWPEGGEGRWPQWCTSPRTPSPQLIRRNLCMTPSAYLLAREWAKHGSCMARTPEAYFTASAALWRSVEPRLPDFDILSRRDGLNARMIREAFVTGNPAWKTDQLGIHLNERGWLKEIRLCYDRSFMPTRCTSSQLGAPDNQRARIWRGL